MESVWVHSIQQLGMIWELLGMPGPFQELGRWVLKLEHQSKLNLSCPVKATQAGACSLQDLQESLMEPW